MYIIIAVAIVIITILAFIGLKVQKQKKALRKKLGLQKSTTKEELDVAIKRFTTKQRQLANTEQRNLWLKSKGYTVKENSTKKKNRPKPLTAYQMAVNRFIKLKREGKIEIYYALHDKFGIPYYEIKKTLGQQIRGV